MRSAGISISSFSRNANTSSVTNAPSIPNAAIHQICQIRAKPVTTAKKAVTKPVAGLPRTRWLGDAAALGVALADPDRRTVLITGEVGAELQTNKTTNDE